jgi:CDP-paratose 2-epimerase
LSLLELFKLLETQIGRPLDFIKGPPRESDQRVFVADLDKISGLISWHPQVSAKEGVSRMLAWVDTLIKPSET